MRRIERDRALVRSERIVDPIEFVERVSKVELGCGTSEGVACVARKPRRMLETRARLVEAPECRERVSMHQGMHRIRGLERLASDERLQRRFVFALPRKRYTEREPCVDGVGMFCEHLTQA
jgi:hypothetical protein